MHPIQLVDPFAGEQTGDHVKFTWKTKSHAVKRFFLQMVGFHSQNVKSGRALLVGGLSVGHVHSSL